MPNKALTIAFVGASGYGNVGDDIYPCLLRRYFSGCNLLFYNSDLPKQMPDGIDLVVIGGGGVVYNNSDRPLNEVSPHFHKMRYYLDWAIRHRIPFGFLSCGFQYRTDVGDKHLDSLELWKPYLSQALFASFRSPQCLDTFAQLTGRDDGCCFPDLGYLNQAVSANPKLVMPSKYAVIVPAGAINPRNEHTLHQIKLLEACGCQTVWVQMGADCDDGPYFEEISREHANWGVIRGASCEEVTAIIAGAEFVISGRYHGMVFARANGVPFYIPTSAPYKLMIEDWNLSPHAASGHVKLLGKHLRELGGNREIKAALFAAGLGDVIRAIYKTSSYEYLSAANSPVPVLVASHNPFAVEIFRHHRNAENFILYELGHKYEEFHELGLRGSAITQALMNFVGLPVDSLIRGAASAEMPIFDAPDIIQSTGHIVLCPFAGSTDGRAFSETLVRQLLERLWRLPVDVYIITRSFPRSRPGGKLIHAAEDACIYEGGNVHVLDDLTVPASLNLIRSSKAYIGSWSSLLQAAWFENKPVATFYPPNWVDVTNRTDYAFGLDREDCFHADFQSINFDKFDEWLDRLMALESQPTRTSHRDREDQPRQDR